MVDLIKPSELVEATTVLDNEAMVVDDGVAVRKATPVQVVNAGAPVPTENEAIAGVDNAKRMTALRVRQVLDSETAPSVLRAQAWAESATPPDPLVPTSKSAKSWAEEAAISEGEAQDHASDAAISAGQALAIKNSLLTDLQASASTLPAGTPATASYNPATMTVSFGIPTGPQGEQGIQGPEGPQGPAGSGDMSKSVYDPNNVSADAFALANMTGTLPPSQITADTNAGMRLVGRTTNTGAYGNVPVAGLATGSTIPIREAAGTIQVATPTVAAHATTKAYVDGLIPTWATISGKPAVIASGATQAAARTSIGLGSLATITPTGTPSIDTVLYGDNTWGASPAAVASGAIGAPRVMPKALSTNLIMWMTFNNTPTAITSIDWMKSIRISGAAAMATQTSVGILQVSFSTDSGATWGAYQNLCTSTSTGSGNNTRTMSVEVEIDLSSGGAYGGIIGGAAIDTATDVTVPVGYNAIRFRCSVNVSYGVIVTAEGGRSDV